jgi:hypothetical protein
MKSVVIMRSHVQNSKLEIQKRRVATIFLLLGILPKLLWNPNVIVCRMKRQILQLLLSAGIGAFFATGCCCPKQVAVVKKSAVLSPTGPVIVKKTAVLPPAAPILVKEYIIPAPRPGEVVVVASTPPPKPVESSWHFTGIRWVWVP